MTKGRRRVHVRWCESASGRLKPQKPFSNCLKGCKAVVLGTCQQRACACCSVTRWSYQRILGCETGGEESKAMLLVVGATFCPSVCLLAVVWSCCTLKDVHKCTVYRTTLLTQTWLDLLWSWTCSFWWVEVQLCFNKGFTSSYQIILCHSRVVRYCHHSVFSDNLKRTLVLLLQFWLSACCFGGFQVLMLFWWTVVAFLLFLVPQ